MKNLILLCSLVFVLVSCFGKSEPHSQHDARVFARYYVEAQLKSPSTAKFAHGTVKKKSENTYHVKGHVDAQNSFGGTIRNDYEMDIEFSEDGKDKKVRNFKMK
jgi:nucleoside diphosphate kinase